MESPGNIWIINSYQGPSESYSDKSQHVTSHFVWIFPWMKWDVFIFPQVFQSSLSFSDLECWNVLIPSVKGKYFCPHLPFSKMFLIPIIVPIYLVVWPRNPTTITIRVKKNQFAWLLWQDRDFLVKIKRQFLNFSMSGSNTTYNLSKISMSGEFLQFLKSLNFLCHVHKHIRFSMHQPQEFLVSLVWCYSN